MGTAQSDVSKKNTNNNNNNNNNDNKNNNNNNNKTARVTTASVKRNKDVSEEMRRMRPQVAQARNMSIGIVAYCVQNIRICMGKKPIVSVTYENERISIKVYLYIESPFT